MNRILRLPVLASMSLLGLAACSDGDRLAGLSPEPTAAESGSIDRALPADTGIVTVVHGVPGLVVDVYVNGALTLPSFAPGTVTDPLSLPEGNYDIVIVPEGGTYPDDGVITGSTFLPAGANASLVAHLTESGAPSLAVFVNDVSPVGFARSRVTVRHLAAAPTVDVRLFRKILPWLPLRTIRNLSNPDEAKTTVFAGNWRAKIYPARSNQAVYTTPYLDIDPGLNAIVYAVGSLADGTFGVLVQTIELPGCDRSAAARRIAEESEETPVTIDAARDEVIVE